MRSWRLSSAVLRLKTSRSGRSASVKGKALWKKRLLPNTFTKLLPASQKDLIRAELAYSTTVSDLPRVAHLLAIVVERELRERIIIPAAKAVFQEQPLPERWERVSLGTSWASWRVRGTCQKPRA